MSQNDLYSRYKRGLFFALGGGALVYLLFSLYAEVPKVLGHLEAFRWVLIFPILGLSLSNYLVRFVRWEYYLRRLEIRVKLKESFTIFMAGLAMTITPGKLGELLKSLLLFETAGTPVARSAPVVVAERLTDFLALVILTAVGIGTYYQDKRFALFLVGAGLVSVIILLNSRTLSLGIIRLSARIPGIGRYAPKLEEAYQATAHLLSPVPLTFGLLLAVASWFAECLGYFVVFNGHGVDVSIKLATFLYSFSVIAGVVSPGGLGVTDLALGVGAQELIEGLSASLAVSAAFIIRLATLWFAVAVGSIALIRFKGRIPDPAPETGPEEPIKTDATPDSPRQRAKT